MAGQVKVTLVRSGIGRPQGQRRTLQGMGLTRLNRTVVLEDTAEVRGMIRKICHLVRVSPVEGECT
jgi:large subunit ribosomal protein L30